MTTALHPYLADAADHQQLAWLGGSTVTVLLDGATTGGGLTALSSELSAGDVSPLHVHSREDEVFVLLSGSAVVWVGDARHEVGARRSGVPAPGPAARVPHHRGRHPDADAGHAGGP